MILATDSLLTQSVAVCQPWEFVAPMEPGLQVRHDKQTRQDWYRSTSTKWNFYTGIEASNPNQRITKKDNPPRLLHAFCADFDVKIPQARMHEAVEAMLYKPQWIETSLGIKKRLIWILPNPIRLEGYEHCEFLLQKAIEWLSLNTLPGLDEGAFTDPTRLLCNGADWEATNKPIIPERALQAFIVGVGREFRFKPVGDAQEIPLDLIEKEIVKKFPNFSWPGDFCLESQGPSFWIPGSTSAMSAIVKKDGMFTFSDHADKPFHSWADILGPSFFKDFNETSITAATQDIYYDTKNFWRKKKGVYTPAGMTEIQNYFKVQCRLSSKPGKSGSSQVDTALDHIYNDNMITGAAPFIFRPTGIMQYTGKTVLNTYIHRVMAPAEGKQVWGTAGNFPFLSLWLDNLFDPVSQLTHFLAWFKYYYTCAHTMSPQPGQNLFLMGGTGTGKTAMSRLVVGRAVGGFVDASDHLINGNQFNSEVYEAPLWCSDDDTSGESQSTHARFQAIWKKSAANQQFKYHKKYEVPLTIDWQGRIICTTNMDFVSSRMVGSMDNSVIDKTSLFRCVSESRFIFPARADMVAIIERELPYFLRWLLDWAPPEIEGGGPYHINENGIVTHVARDVRFGYRSFQEASLLDMAHQTSRASAFKELLIASLRVFFESDKSAAEWRGTSTELIQLLHNNPLNESIIRSLRLEQTPRYLEFIHREGILKCAVETGEMKTRIWVFKRFEKAQSVTPELLIDTETFSK